MLRKVIMSLKKDKKFVETKRKDRQYGLHKVPRKSGKHRSHQLGLSTTEQILRQSKGRGGHGQGRDTGNEAISRTLNDRVNVRSKTPNSNQKLDERRDRRIVEAHKTGEHLTERTTAKRAVQAHKGGKTAAAKHGNKAVAQVAREIGEMTYNDGKPGRPIKIKNLAKR